jgi:hypothetical protein
MVRREVKRGRIAKPTALGFSPRLFGYYPEGQNTLEAAAAPSSPAAPGRRFCGRRGTRSSWCPLVTDDAGRTGGHLSWPEASSTSLSPVSVASRPPKPKGCRVAGEDGRLPQMQPSPLPHEGLTRRAACTDYGRPASPGRCARDGFVHGWMKRGVQRQ